MTTVPKISIVTPSDDTARFLREAIEGVLSRAGDLTIEYFVMDGGSIDGSTSIIERCASRMVSGHCVRSVPARTMLAGPSRLAGHERDQRVLDAKMAFVARECARRGEPGAPMRLRAGNRDEDD